MIISCYRFCDLRCSVGYVLSVVDGVVGMIGVLLQMFSWFCGVIFTVSLCIGECDEGGAVGALVVVNRVIAVLVVSLKILLS